MIYSVMYCVVIVVFVGMMLLAMSLLEANRAIIAKRFFPSQIDNHDFPFPKGWDAEATFPYFIGTVISLFISCIASLCQWWFTTWIFLGLPFLVNGIIVGLYLTYHLLDKAIKSCLKDNES